MWGLPFSKEKIYALRNALPYGVFVEMPLEGITRLKGFFTERAECRLYIGNYRLPPEHGANCQTKGCYFWSFQKRKLAQNRTLTFGKIFL